MSLTTGNEPPALRQAIEETLDMAFGRFPRDLLDRPMQPGDKLTVRGMFDLDGNVVPGHTYVIGKVSETKLIAFQDEAGEEA